MLERAKEVTRDGGWARVEYARYADDLVTLVDGYRRHAWLRVAEVAIASPSPAGAWILRNAETGDVNFASLPGTRAHWRPAVPAAPASDNARLRHVQAAHGRADRRRRVFMLTTLPSFGGAGVELLIEPASTITTHRDQHRSRSRGNEPPS